MKLEVACFNRQSAMTAAASGADRIELCADAGLGGTTPDLTLLRALKAELQLPIFVMIRPRGGNFVYSDAEFGQMREDLLRFLPFADGFVTGILTDRGEIDIERNRQLTALADVPFTFHRAFDEIENQAAALEAVIYCGFRTLLTSGGRGNAADHIGRLAELVRLSNDRIGIMPGGGVRSSNLPKLLDSCADWFHTSAVVSANGNADADEIRKMKEISRKGR